MKTQILWLKFCYGNKFYIKVKPFAILFATTYFDWYFLKHMHIFLKASATKQLLPKIQIIQIIHRKTWDNLFA